MQKLGLIRRFTAALAATTAVAVVFAGQAAADPAEVDWNTAARQLRAAAAGNPAAEQAVDRLIASGQVATAGQVALPAQPFQVPAQSDIGRGDGPGVYGSGIALGYDGFRFGFFGGPGTISPNQNGAKLEVMWINLSNGRSGTEVLSEHNDVPVDTTIRTRPLDIGGGMIVTAVYGTLWHRSPAPVSDANPDGFRYQRGTISIPSFGVIYN
ncbi:hypothetical protein ACFQZZ_19255 [Nocardia sp. GCM10030253]|uniref:hypothetical protein n=1 Tax=Nocardia sp. GCM10030253 TaxID=3273404 RepID=UPI003628CD51